VGAASAHPGYALTSCNRRTSPVSSRHTASTLGRGGFARKCLEGADTHEIREQSHNISDVSDRNARGHCDERFVRVELGLTLPEFMHRSRVRVKHLGVNRSVKLSLTRSSVCGTAGRVEQAEPPLREGTGAAQPRGRPSSARRRNLSEEAQPHGDSSSLAARFQTRRTARGVIRGSPTAAVQTVALPLRRSRQGRALILRLFRCSLQDRLFTHIPLVVVPVELATSSRLRRTRCLTN
jgi:hypothetical protein